MAFKRVLTNYELFYSHHIGDTGTKYLFLFAQNKVKRPRKVAFVCVRTSFLWSKCQGKNHQVCLMVLLRFLRRRSM